MLIDFAFFAEGVQVRPDGRMDVKGMGAPTVVTTQIPFAFPNVSVFAVVGFTEGERDGESYPVHLSLVAPDGSIAFYSAVSVPKVQGRDGNLVPVALLNVTIAQEGRYAMRWQSGDSVYETTCFQVRVRGA